MGSTLMAAIEHLPANIATLHAGVNRLHGAYCRAIDEGDGDAWSRVFHPDGVSIGPDRPEVRGRRALRAFVENRIRTDLVHLTVNSRIDRVDGDVVHVDAYYVILGPSGPAWQPIMTGTYADAVTAHDGELVLLERRATPWPRNIN